MMTIEGVYELADGEKGVVSLRIKGEGKGKWMVQAKLVNTMSSKVVEKYGVFNPGPVMSTRMMPPPELQDLEREISHLVSQLTNISKNGRFYINV